MEKLSGARHIVERLVQHDFEAYFVGGWVRDYLMGFHSDDIDIATNAPPEAIQALFPKTIPVGISFGIVVVVIHNIHYEVATFRSEGKYCDGRHPKHVSFTDAKHDALRRDFTINSLFYDPIKGKVLDFVRGRQDIEKKVIRTVGKPQTRFEEDRLRMIRAVRYACRFNFRIEKKTLLAIKRFASALLPSVSIERIWQEFEKMAQFSTLPQCLSMLYSFGLLTAIFPELQSIEKKMATTRLKRIARFPKGTPIILYLAELLEVSSEKEVLHLCRYLKVSNKNKTILEQFWKGKELVSKEDEGHSDLVEWAHYYALSHSALTLDVITTQIEAKKKKAFIARHKRRKQRLQSAIARIKERTPLISGKDLAKEGIAPGKVMGALLKEAERLSIVLGIEDPKKLLKALKRKKFC